MPASAAPERDPRDDRRPAVHVVLLEVARIELLQHDPGRERDRQHEQPQRARQNGRAARKRKRERHEAGRSPRLRERHEVGEPREEKRRELEREHEHHPAEHERAPAPPGGERRERRQHERGDRDRARARRRDRARGGSSRASCTERSVEYCASAAALLGRSRIVRSRLGDDRREPREDGEHRQPERKEAADARAQILARGEQRARARIRRAESR